MKALSLEIKPLKGFGELEFGMTPDEVMSYLGKPDDQETLDDDEDEKTLIYHFDDRDISAFFEVTEDDEQVLVNVETGNHEATLYGQNIFAMKEKEIIALMKKNGYTEIDTEVLEDEEYQNEKRVSFDEAMMDFFFEDEILTAISWGNFFFDEEED